MSADFLIVFLSVSEVAIILTAIYLLIKDGSRPVRIWAWILVIIFIPVFGALLYFSFGVNLRKQKMFNLKKVIDYNRFEEFIREYSVKAEEQITQRGGIPQTYLNLIRLLIRINSSLPTFNNRIKVLQNGEDTFNAIFKACEQANEFIHLQYYIFSEGELADRFIEIFERKIQEGVTVRMLYDSVGSWNTSENALSRLKSIGVQVHAFMPVRFGALARVNYRNHRKILIVDGEVGFTGGINVDDKYIKGDKKLGSWTDTHVQIHGMSINFLNFVFLCDWQFVSKENLIHRDSFKVLEPIGDTPVQIVSSGPDTDYPNILQQYLYILHQANHYVYIANPYIVPDSTLLMALKTVGLSGVDIRLIVPLHSDSTIVHWTVRSFFSELLQAGVRIFQFQGGFLHSKIIISDDAICSIGTANLDIRSFEQNFEVNALIYEREATLQLKSHFKEILSESREISYEEYRKRPKSHRVKEKLARLTSPLM